MILKRFSIILLVASMFLISAQLYAANQYEGKRIDALLKQIDQLKESWAATPAPQPPPAAKEPETTQPDSGQASDSIQEQSIE